MEGRSGLTLLLHTPVLSLTLVYIIFLVCSSCAAGRGRGARHLTCSPAHKNVHTQTTAATGAIFSLSEAPPAREVSTGIFYFFSGPETGGDSGDNFLVPDPGPFLVPDPGLFLF